MGNSQDLSESNHISELSGLLSFEIQKVVKILETLNEGQESFLKHLNKFLKYSVEQLTIQLTEQEGRMFFQEQIQDHYQDLSLAIHLQIIKVKEQVEMEKQRFDLITCNHKQKSMIRKEYLRSLNSIAQSLLKVISKEQVIVLVSNIFKAQFKSELNQLEASQFEMAELIEPQDQKEFCNEMNNKKASNIEESKQNSFGMQDTEISKLDLVVVENYKYEDGSVYTGQMHQKMRHGRGRITYANGDCYDGFWNKDKAEGFGKSTSHNGETYQGRWLNNLKHGTGTYTSISGIKVTGQWENNMMNGHGVETWDDGSSYEGQYKDGEKEGKGKYIWSDGSTYEGDWEKGVIQGKGVYTWADQRQYTGDWKNNKMQGYGIYTWGDGRKYEGSYVEDKKEGYGVYYWADGRMYEGTWKNGKQDGNGLYTTSQGEKKQGLWNNGKRIKWIES